MIKRPLLFATIVIAVACGQSTAPVQADLQVPHTTKEVAITAGEPVTTADLSISGMTCEMMCGGAIKDALAKLKGVDHTDIAFTAEEGQPSHAVVTYDPAQVSDEEMVRTVQALHEGQYKVLAVEITKQVVRTGEAAGPDGTEETEKVNASALGEVVIPSVLALLTRLVQL
jgi:copper chaperone CopZ